MARGGFSTRIERNGYGPNITDGLNKGRAALRKLREMGENLLPFMEDARNVLVKSVQQRFEGGFGPGRIPWQKSRRALGLVKGKPAGRTLVDTEELQDSIRGEAGADYAEVGSDGLLNPVKAIANQFGSRRQTVVKRHVRIITQAFGAPLAQADAVDVRAHGRVTNLPARPFVGIDRDDVDQIKEAWQTRIIATFGANRNG